MKKLFLLLALSAGLCLPALADSDDIIRLPVTFSTATAAQRAYPPNKVGVFRFTADRDKLISTAYYIVYPANGAKCSLGLYDQQKMKILQLPVQEYSPGVSVRIVPFPVMLITGGSTYYHAWTCNEGTMSKWVTVLSSDEVETRVLNAGKPVMGYAQFLSVGGVLPDALGTITPMPLQVVGQTFGIPSVKYANYQD